MAPPPIYRNRYQHENVYESNPVFARTYQRMQQIWARASALYFGGAAMAMPHFKPPRPVDVDPGTPAWVGTWWDKDGRPRGIAWTTRLQTALLDRRDPYHQFALYALIHEFAHTRQAREQFDFSDPDQQIKAEGGAHAFAAIAAPQIYRSLGVPYRAPLFGEMSEIERRAREAVNKYGVDWVMRGQFVA